MRAHRRPGNQTLILELMDALVSSLDLSEVLPRAHGVLSRLLPADYAAFCVSKPGFPTEYDWVVAEVPQKFFSHYSEIAAEDFVRQAVMQRPNVVLRDSDMVPREVLERSLLYRRCRELGMPLEHAIAVMLDMGLPWHGGFTLYRERRRPFSEEEQGFLQALTSALGSTVRNCKLLGELASRKNFLEALAHHQGTELIVLSPPSTEVMRSERATSLLERWFAPIDRGPHGLPSEWLERLQRQASTGGLEMLAQDSWEHVRRDHRLRVTVIRLPEEGGRRHWGLVLKEVTRVARVPESWKKLLTPREAQVVEGVLQGWDNQSIADQLSCSGETVKTHLKHIFLKLHVASRAKLIAAAQELV